VRGSLKAQLFMDAARSGHQRDEENLFIAENANNILAISSKAKTWRCVWRSHCLEKLPSFYRLLFLQQVKNSVN